MPRVVSVAESSCGSSAAESQSSIHAPLLAHGTPAPKSPSVTVASIEESLVASPVNSGPALGSPVVSIASSGNVASIANSVTSIVKSGPPPGSPVASIASCGASSEPIESLLPHLADISSDDASRALVEENSDDEDCIDSGSCTGNSASSIEFEQLPFLNTKKTPALGMDSIFAGVEERKPKEELGTPNIAERVSAS